MKLHQLKFNIILERHGVSKILHEFTALSKLFEDFSRRGKIRTTEYLGGFVNGVKYLISHMAEMPNDKEAKRQRPLKNDPQYSYYRIRYWSGEFRKFCQKSLKTQY
jgi:hypothetical protein